MWKRFVRLFSTRRLDRDLEEELAFHLERDEENLRHAGSSAAEARFEARRRLGNRGQLGEDARAPWRVAALDRLGQDLRYGFRRLRRAPGFVAAAAATLGLGVGANAAVANLVRAALLTPTAGIADPGRVVNLYLADFSSTEFGTMSFPDFRVLAAETTLFAGAAAYAGVEVTAQLGGEPEIISAQLASSGFFPLLGTRPRAGRLFGGGSELAEPAAVLTERLAARIARSPEAAIGITIRVNGFSVPVVGVVSDRFVGMDRTSPAEIWLPLESAPLLSTGGSLTKTGDRWLSAVARLREGISAAATAPRLAGLSRVMAEQLPQEWRTVRGEARAISVVPESEARLGPDNEGTAWRVSLLLISIVGVVLLLACANVAGLLLARSEVSQIEVALRQALGASRPRLIRQALTEHVMLGALGGFAGFATAAGLTTWLRRAMPRLRLPASLPLEGGAELLALSLAIGIGATVLFGLGPAMAFARRSAANPIVALRPSAGTRSGLRGVLVMAQLALALVLLVGASVLSRSLGRVLSLEPGFLPNGLGFVTLNLDRGGYSPDRQSAFFDELAGRAAAVPGVERVGLISRLPVVGQMSRRGLTIEGYQRREGESTETGYAIVSPGYFETIGIPIVSGRAIESADHPGAPGAVVVNQAFVERYWPDGRALGRRLVDSRDNDLEVVGVARTAAYRTLGEDPLPFIYVSSGQQVRPQATLIARGGDPAEVARQLRQLVRDLDPGLPIVRSGTVAGLFEPIYYPLRAGSFLVGLFAALAAFLASVGLYGTLAYIVARRTREIGVRLAIGASQRQVLRGVLFQGLKWAIGGGLVGVVLAQSVTRLIGSALSQSAAAGGLTYVGSACLLIGVALVASAVPALRAARVNPMIALREA